MVAAPPDGSASANALLATWCSFDAPGPNSHRQRDVRNGSWQHNPASPLISHGSVTAPMFATVSAATERAPPWEAVMVVEAGSLKRVSAVPTRRSGRGRVGGNAPSPRLQAGFPVGHAHSEHCWRRTRPNGTLHMAPVRFGHNRSPTSRTTPRTLTWRPSALAFLLKRGLLFDGSGLNGYRSDALGMGFPQ